MNRKRALVTAGGFTLIELMAVMVILALATALVVPRLGGWIEPARLDLAQSRVLDCLAIARTLGRQTGASVALLYDVSGVRLVPHSGAGDPVTFRFGGDVHIAYVEVAGTRRSPRRGDVVVPMRASGICPHHRIGLALDGGGEGRVLEINGLTGAVRAERR